MDMEEGETSTMNQLEEEAEEMANGNPRTAETVLTAAKSYLDCPVCFETLVSPIYQCENGHVVCNNCIKRLAKCAECRVPLTPETRIRNVALENICRSVDVKCPNEGCGVRTTVELLKTHLESCGFQPINFCSRILGWKDCKVPVNDSSVLSHLDSEHSIKKVNSSKFQICLNVWGCSLAEDEEVHFEPLVVTGLDTPVLLRSMLSMNEHIMLTCFMLKNTRDDDVKSYRVKYCIEPQNKEHELEWSGYVQSYRKLKKSNSSNSFLIPVEYFEFHLPIGQPDPHPGSTASIHAWIKMSIRVAVYKATEPSPSLKEEVYEEVDLFGQSSLHDPELSSTVILSPGRPIRNKCLQYRGYNLWSRCMELGRHAFVRVQDFIRNIRVHLSNSSR